VVAGPEELRRDRKQLPKLVVDKALDLAMQLDRFNLRLSRVQTAVATWSTEAETFGPRLWSTSRRLTIFGEG
jgi:hypothetical protein